MESLWPRVQGQCHGPERPPLSTTSKQEPHHSLTHLTEMECCAHTSRLKVKPELYSCLAQTTQLPAPCPGTQSLAWLKKLLKCGGKGCVSLSLSLSLRFNHVAFPRVSTTIPSHLRLMRGKARDCVMTYLLEE